MEGLIYGKIEQPVAELLMASPKEAKIRMAEDEILAQKAFIIYRDLYRWSEGRMNGRYFDALRKGEVDEEYWAKREISF